MKALVEYKKPFTIKVYPRAYHAFFDDTHPQVYNEEAAQDAWQMVLKFFNANLR